MPTEAELFWFPKVRKRFLDWIEGPNGEICCAGFSPMSKHAERLGQLERFARNLPSRYEKVVSVLASQPTMRSKS